MILCLVHHHHNIVGRLVIHQQISVTVGDDPSRRIFYLLEKSIRVGTLLVVVARNLKHEKADDVDYHNQRSHTSYDIMSIV